MTLRLPRELGLGVERYAARTGHKPAHVGALAVDEFMRRRNFPLIDFRDTAAGRVAYVKGTRLAVYWLAETIKRMKGGLRQACGTWNLAPEKIRAALHYAEAYPQEIKMLQEQADENRAALQAAERALTRAEPRRTREHPSRTRPGTGQ